MSRRVGLIGRIFQNFKNSFGEPKRKLVGVDHHGNKYFEKESDAAKNFRSSRSFEAVDTDRSAVPEVPPEWDAWLRYRRKEPPSQKEIERNIALMLRTKQRAQDLEEKELQSKGKNQESTSSKSFTSSVDPDEVTSKSKFPDRSEYEYTPGDKRK